MFVVWLITVWCDYYYGWVCLSCFGLGSVVGLVWCFVGWLCVVFGLVYSFSWVGWVGLVFGCS